MSDLQSIGLPEAIEALRRDLELAVASAGTEAMTFPITRMTVELKVVATSGASGKAGFRVPLIGAEIGVEANDSRESTHTVSLELGAPLDTDGNPVRVARTELTPLD